MIRVVSGDLFASGADALVNPVNCLGVSGAGLALAFAKKFPVEHRQYESRARTGELALGTVLVIPTETLAHKYIVFFPTKGHWREQSRLEPITEGLMCLRGWLLTTPAVRSIAIPALGCGLGGLEWPPMRERIEHALRDVNRVDVMLYPPQAKRGPR